jgi:hypothetical protein
LFPPGKAVHSAMHSATTTIPVYGATTAHVPRIAAFGLTPGECEHFTTAFRNVKFSVEVVPLASLPSDGAFDGAIVHANGDAAPLLTALRARSRRMLLYVIGPMPQIARLAQFGINAALESVTDANIARAVEHTYLLLAGKLRRFTRVPLYIPVNVQSGAVTFSAITEDLSGGGISLILPTASAMVHAGQAVSMRIMLPAAEPLQVHGVVCRVAGEQVGIQFERDLEQEKLRNWVEEFLA